MDPTWLIANWKMNGDAARARDWAFAVNATLREHGARVTVVLCPPALYLSAARSALPQNAQLKLGAQNCHAQTSGAFTGEISAVMLKESGCGYVILGHSERRAMGETDEEVRLKAQSAIAAGLIPVICIGESRAEYEAKATHDVLGRQVDGLRVLPEGSYLIAYEPVWAIGQNATPEPLEIEAAHSQIKSVLGTRVCVLYGGSVKAENIAKILEVRGVSGVLIGGASLDETSMRAMIAAARDRTLGN